MKKMGSLVILALGLTACGGQQKNAAGESERVAFNDEVKAALAAETESLPAAMIVKVPLGADGKEDPAKAELRAAKAASSDVVTTWESAEKTASPSDSDTFVVVNPHEAAVAAAPTVAALQDRYPYANDVIRGDNESVNTASTTGNNGLVVTGSNNYTYFNQINTNSQQNAGVQDNDRYARYYGHSVQPSYYNRGCYGASWCNNYGWGGYYQHAYRPVYRSWSYGYRPGGYAGYWGYYSNPYRYVRGNDCYYIYGRPAVYGASVTASTFGWGY